VPTGLHHAIAGETEADCTEGGGAKSAGHAGRGATKVVPDQSQERNRPRVSPLQRYANRDLVICSRYIRLIFRDFGLLQKTNVLKVCFVFIFVYRKTSCAAETIYKQARDEGNNGKVRVIV
jgi:hypothetical protein